VPQCFYTRLKPDQDEEGGVTIFGGKLRWALVVEALPQVSPYPRKWRSCANQKLGPLCHHWQLGKHELLQYTYHVESTP
jgi:hypothetical protein